MAQCMRLRDLKTAWDNGARSWSYGGTLQLTSGPRTARRQMEVLLFDFSDQCLESRHICKTGLRYPLSEYQEGGFPRKCDNHCFPRVLEAHRLTWSRSSSGS